MSDRKYRQRGYQDDDRDRKPAHGPKPAAQPGPPHGARGDRAEGPKTPNLMAAHEVVKCSRCGTRVTSDIDFTIRCAKCGADLHACGQCASFDPGSRFQCMQAIPERIAAKDTRNTCTFYAPRTTIERQTGSTAPTTARSAFDALFKN
jgi:hypothetical protein